MGTRNCRKNVYVSLLTNWSCFFRRVKRRVTYKKKTEKKTEKVGITSPGDCYIGDVRVVKRCLKVSWSVRQKKSKLIVVSISRVSVNFYLKYDSFVPLRQLIRLHAQLTLETKWFLVKNSKRKHEVRVNEHLIDDSTLKQTRNGEGEKKNHLNTMFKVAAFWSICCPPLPSYTFSSSPHQQIPGK